MERVKVGDTIRIVYIDDVFAIDYNGREGVVERIDETAGFIHGTWGDLPLMPKYDTFEIVNTK